MIRIPSIAGLVVAVLLGVLAAAGPARAQQAAPATPPSAGGAQLSGPGASRDLEALLRSYGFELKHEDGDRVVEVTLRQVLQLALERNLDLQSVRVGQSVARSQLRAARERLNPTVTSELGYARSQSASFFGTGTDFLNLSGTDALTFSSEYRKPTETGIEYALRFDERRTRPLVNAIPTEGDDPTGVEAGEWLSSSALTGSLNIPIGQDFGRAFNNLPVRRAETGVAGSRITIRQRELQLVEATAQVYWDLVGALERLRVAEEAVGLSEQLLEDNRQRLEAGVLSPFDVQVTRTQLARDREAVTTSRAEVLRIEDQARALLNLQVIDFEVRPLDRPAVHDLGLDYRALRERLYAQSPDVKALENQLTANGLALQEARNAERTNLDLELYYTAQGFNGSPLGGVSGFSQTSTDGYGAVFTWTVPLFDVVTEETIRQRTLERQQLELQLESVRSDLNVRLQSVLRQLRVAEEQVDTARTTRQLAEEQLRNEIERFRVGESTSFQVAQAQQDASEAQVQEILARVNFERNLLQLRVLTGDIYRHYDLERSYE